MKLGRIKKLKAGNIFFTPKGAIIVFGVMIAGIMGLNYAKGRRVLRARRLTAYAAARHGVIPIGTGTKGKRKRSVPLDNLNPAWRRQWDTMSGSSRFSRDMLQGRKLGAHLHQA